jgi:rubrerythrin
MRFSDRLSRIVRGETRTVHHECRRCGRNLSDDPGQCPACGGSVATYEL